MSNAYAAAIPAPTPTSTFRISFDSTLARPAGLVLRIVLVYGLGWLFLRWLCRPEEAWVIRYALMLWAGEVLYFVLRQLVRALRAP